MTYSLHSGELKKKSRNLVKVGAIFGIVIAFLFLYLVRDSWTIQSPVKKNVILMISDGFGPASETFARNYAQYFKKQADLILPLDTILVGSSRTRSSSSLITDSAAGATAFSCALKTYNGAIGVDPQKKACGTILEAAKDIGYITGLVVTSRITHATPASFSAHAVDRNMESLIAAQQVGNYTLGRMVDLMFGGGLCFFRGNSDLKSCRTDDLDILSWAKSHGWSFGTSKATFDQLNETIQLPLINLFTEDHMSYEIDRDSKLEPSLQEMVAKALKILSNATKNSQQGFLLIIEGSRIDMAAHGNDPAAHLHEILAYQDAISEVKTFVDANPSTVMISVADHETGGISVGHQRGSTYPTYEWKPEVLQNVKYSGEYIFRELQKITSQDTKKSFVVETVFPKWLNLYNFTQEDVEFLTNENSMSSVESYIGHMISDLAGIGWATHGHSAVDVNLYAYGHSSDDLRGNHENTDIGAFIVRKLGLQLEPITARLRDCETSEPKSERTETNLRHFHS